MSEPHPTVGLNDTVHQRARLGILTILAEAGRADFSYLKQALELTDGNLGRHLEVLERENLVSLKKGYAGKRPKTWVTITATGRRALDEQIATLRAIVARFEPPVEP